jgi:hypothetical protein
MFPSKSVKWKTSEDISQENLELFDQYFSVLREHNAGSDLSKEAAGTFSSLSDHGHSFSLGNSLTHL